VSEFRLINEMVKRNACMAIMNAQEGMSAKIFEETRTQMQNRKLWPMLQDVSKQVKWWHTKAGEESPIFGLMKDFDWKHIFTASMRGCEGALGLNGETVVFGKETSKMGKKEFAILIEIIYAFGANNGVVWSEKSLDGFGEYIG
jgi:hypothetical protein